MVVIFGVLEFERYFLMFPNKEDIRFFFLEAGVSPVF